MEYLSKEKYKQLKKSNKEEWLKYCYDLCIDCNWTKSKLTKYKEMYDYIDDNSLIEAGKRYAKKYLHYSTEEITAMIRKKHNINTKYKDLIGQIIELTDEKEIAELFDNYTIYNLFNKIEYYIKHYKKDLTSEEQNKLLTKTLEKIRPIIEEKELNKKNKAKERQRERDKEALEKFKEVINGNLTEKELINNLGKKRFNRLLDVLKEIDNDFYNMYIKTVNWQNIEQEQEQQNKIFKIHQMIYEIVNYLKNGIEEDNKLRKFDIVDFYLLYKDDIKEIYKQISECISIKDDIKLIKNFINENVYYSKKIFAGYKKRLVEGIDRINCEKDERELLIPNTGIVIPIEEKKSWFEYLERNNIPVTDKTYNAMRKRYLNKLDNNKFVKKLTKND